MENKPERKIYRTAQMPAVKAPAQKPGASAVKKAGIYRVFNIVFAAVYGIALVLAIVFNPGAVQHASWYWLLLAAVLGMALALGASRLFMFLKTPEKRGEIITVAALMVVLAGLQVFFGVMLRVQPVDTGDFGLVYNYAANYALTGAVPDAYFLYNPTHGGLYVLLTGFFSLLGLFGVSDFVIPALILNILAVDGAVLMLYFCARRLFGQNKAIFLLVLSIFCLPFYLFIPIFYTATFSMPVVVGIALLWLRTRAAWRAGNQKKAWIQFGILSAVAGLGALVKTTVLIVWIAAALDFIILLAGKGRWKVLLSGLGIVAVLYAGGFFGLRYLPILPQYDSGDTFPPAGWVLMGLQENGGFNEETYEDIIAQEGAARSAYASYELGKVLSDPLDVLGQLGRKVAYTFGDGTYEAPLELDRSPISWSFLHDYVLPYGASFAVFYYVAFGLHAAVLGWMLVAAVKAFARKNNALTFVRVALFGLFLFLLMWKTSPGELVNFIPLYLLCALEASPMPKPKHIPRSRARAAVPAAPVVAVEPVVPTEEPAAVDAVVVDEAPAEEASNLATPEPETVAEPEFEPEITPEPEPAEEPVTVELPADQTLENILDDMTMEPVAEILPEDAPVEHLGYQPYEAQDAPVPEIDYADYIQAMPEDMYELQPEDAAVELAPEEAAPVADLDLESQISPIEIGGGADWMLAGGQEPQADIDVTLPELEEGLEFEQPAAVPAPETNWGFESVTDGEPAEMGAAELEPAAEMLAAAWADDAEAEVTEPEVKAEPEAADAEPPETEHIEAELAPEEAILEEVTPDEVPTAEADETAQDDFAEFSQWLEAGTPPAQQPEAEPVLEAALPEVAAESDQSEAIAEPAPAFEAATELVAALEPEAYPEMEAETSAEQEPTLEFEAAPEYEAVPEAEGVPDYAPAFGSEPAVEPEPVPDPWFAVPSEGEAESHTWPTTEPTSKPAVEPVVTEWEVPIPDINLDGDEASAGPVEAAPAPEAEPQPDYVLPDWQPISGVHYGNVPPSAPEASYQYAPTEYTPDVTPQWQPLDNVEYEEVAPSEQPLYDTPAYGRHILEPELEPVAPTFDTFAELLQPAEAPEDAVPQPNYEAQPVYDTVPQPDAWAESPFEPQAGVVEPTPVEGSADVFAQKPIVEEQTPTEGFADAFVQQSAVDEPAPQPAATPVASEDKPDLEVQDEFQVGDGLMGEVEVWNAANGSGWMPEEGQQMWPPIIPGLFEPTQVPTTVERAPQPPQPAQDAFDMPTIPQEDEWPAPQFPPIVPEVKTGPPVPLEDEDDEKSLWDFI